MNDQYQPAHVNTFEENHYQPEQVSTVQPEPDQPEQVNAVQPEPYQPEQVNALENNRFYDKPLDTPLAAAEPVQEAVIVEEKTEPWQQAAVIAASPEMLFSSEETQQFRARWNEVQAKFVDEPASSVREADTLVAEVMEKITQLFAGQRQTLESQWSKGDTSTEDLRQVLQHYRAFFNRLLK